MLTPLGKMSAALVIAGGALLARPGGASAVTMAPCNADELMVACASSSGSGYQDSNGTWWCPGGITYCNSSNGEITWTIDFFDNGTQPCPSTLPC